MNHGESRGEVQLLTTIRRTMHRMCRCVIDCKYGQCGDHQKDIGKRNPSLAGLWVGAVGTRRLMQNVTLG